jgi:hypothetical protein
MTAGGAIGAPLAGLAIDASGWHGGFVLPSLIALGVAVLGLLALQRGIGGGSDGPAPPVSAEAPPATTIADALA